MKKLLISFCIIAALASCKKATPPTNSYINFTIDGTTTYHYSLRTSETTNYLGGGEYATIISAFDSATLSSPGITLQIQSPGVVAAKTYTEGGNIANTEFATVSYGNPYATGGSLYADDYSTTNPFEIIVTSATSHNIQGTFSGDAYLNGDNTQTKQVISNGSFNVSF